jgi:hypothetical protein
LGSPPAARVRSSGPRRCFVLKHKFAALSIRKGHKKSIKTLAHKMLRIIYAIFNDGTHYKDRVVDCDVLVVQLRLRTAPLQDDTRTAF